MIGAIVGDIVGSTFEHSPMKSVDGFSLFCPHSFFTDDTVLTVAIADSILTGAPYVRKLKEYFWRYPNAGYGGSFARWATSKDDAPYNSWGNGSAMRVSPVGFAYDTLDEVLERAKQSAAVTHDHPEGIKGAQATAACILLARQGKSRDQIRSYVETTFAYNLHRTVDEIRPAYAYDVSCQGSVPESITCALESTGFEHAVRLAISLGGDADTMACIAGGIAQALHGGVPDKIKAHAMRLLDDPLRDVVRRFGESYKCT
ncbi:MAG: ADP-ribosylglycohydrolase family protein [Candidatus Lokiarchaeota archaeon]|nr:ADP-ribosylglycohydrolase family protein [Candidatus Lokiarchaeota archaeon]